MTTAVRFPPVTLSGTREADVMRFPPVTPSGTRRAGGVEGRMQSKGAAVLRLRACGAPLRMTTAVRFPLVTLSGTREADVMRFPPVTLSGTRRAGGVEGRVQSKGVTVLRLRACDAPLIMTESFET